MGDYSNDPVYFWAEELVGHLIWSCLHWRYLVSWSHHPGEDSTGLRGLRLYLIKK